MSKAKDKNVKLTKAGKPRKKPGNRRNSSYGRTRNSRKKDL